MCPSVFAYRLLPCISLVFLFPSSPSLFPYSYRIYLISPSFPTLTLYFILLSSPFHLFFLSLLPSFPPLFFSVPSYVSVFSMTPLVWQLVPRVLFSSAGSHDTDTIFFLFCCLSLSQVTQHSFYSVPLHNLLPPVLISYTIRMSIYCIHICMPDITELSNQVI